jgi:cell division protein FtsB
VKADDRRDRELIRQLRRELDEAKRRNTDMITELSDLRKERDQSKM